MAAKGKGKGGNKQKEKDKDKKNNVDKSSRICFTFLKSGACTKQGCEYSHNKKLREAEIKRKNDAKGASKSGSSSAKKPTPARLTVVPRRRIAISGMKPRVPPLSPMLKLLPPQRVKVKALILHPKAPPKPKLERNDAQEASPAPLAAAAVGGTSGPTIEGAAPGEQPSSRRAQRRANVAVCIAMKRQPRLRSWSPPRTPIAAVRRQRSDQIHWIMDTGSGHDIVTESKLSRAEMSRAFDTESGISFSTANGTVDAARQVYMQIPNMTEDANPFVMPESPPLLSVGRRCMLDGYSFI